MLPVFNLTMIVVLWKVQKAGVPILVKDNTLLLIWWLAPPLKLRMILGAASFQPWWLETLANIMSDLCCCRRRDCDQKITVAMHFGWQLTFDQNTCESQVVSYNAIGLPLLDWAMLKSGLSEAGVEARVEPGRGVARKLVHFWYLPGLHAPDRLEVEASIYILIEIQLEMSANDSCSIFGEG